MAYQFNNVTLDADFVPVPEPSAMLLFGAGIASLLVRRVKQA